jgi:hypothetical protein
LAFSGVGHLSLACVLSGRLAQFKILGPRAQTSNYQTIYLPFHVLFCIQIKKKKKSKPNPKNRMLLGLYFPLSIKEFRLQLTPEMEQKLCMGPGTEEQGLLILPEETQ